MVCLGHKLDQWQALGPFPGGDGHHTVTSSPVPAVNAVERMKGRTRTVVMGARVVSSRVRSAFPVRPIVFQGSLTHPQTRWRSIL